jgi:hypothetical protein
MFYFASDNPLAPSIVLQLKALKDAGFHPEANVIAHFDPHTPNTPTHVFDVNYVEKLKALGGSQVGHGNDPSVRNLVLDKVWGDREEDKEIRRQISELLSEPLRKSLAGSRNGDGDDDDEYGGGENGHGENGHGGNGAVRAKAAALTVASASEAVKKEMLAKFARPDFGLPVLDADGLSSESNPAVSLEKFLLFCKKVYPARHYILFLLGHGLAVGDKMFMFDEHSAPRRARPDAGGGGRDAEREAKREAKREVKCEDDEEIDVSSSLTLKDLALALDRFNEAEEDADEKGAVKLELIGFHSCSMSGLEVAYELRGRANYMMASQGPAFVGSWPYRQILLQLFNSLNAGLRPEDLTDAPALMSRLKAVDDSDSDSVSKYVRGKFPQTVNKQLKERDDVGALVRGLRVVLNDAGLCDAECVGDIEMKEPTRHLFSRARSLRNANRRRLNRLLLADAYPGAITPNPATGGKYVKELLKKFYYSVLYNSADFQLAGYSFDLCLCDLNKVGELKGPIDNLARALKRGMAGDPGLVPGTVPLARELVLLAHWDAQSFWQDSYTDLHDFCFRLKGRCEHVFSWKGQAAAGSPHFPILRDIIEACDEVMGKLRHDPKDDDDRVIVRAEFAGAEYQYSHGLSIYFPWSRPADGFFEEKYRQYEFAETGWDEFLDEYFTKTRRESFGQENPGLAPAPASAERKTQAAILESLLRDIGTRVFTDGQLAKGAGNDSTGRGAGDDPSGDCDCSSIKNYPPFTGNPGGAGAEREDSPVRGEFSPHFYEHAGQTAK